MKLTVSNTAMMRPLLHLGSRPLRSSPPQRVVGLLEHSQVLPQQHNGPQKLVQYSRPDCPHALLQTAKWQNFLSLNNTKHVSCIAVFGFKFDGVRTWYQVCNRITDRKCWLLHDNNMNYEAFAILTMDALVSLLPNWDCTLHQSPGTQGDAHAVGHKHETIDAKRINTLLVSDASTSAAGRLWFLVTISSKSTQCDTESNMVATQSGWICPTI